MRERKERWISAVSQDDLSEKILNSDRICSRHFVSGCPAKSWDIYNIDWVPTLHLGHSKFPPVNVKGKEEWAERAKSRRKRQIQQHLKEAAEKRKCIDEPGQPVYEITNFSGDDLDEDTLNSDEKQEGTVVETEADADEQQLQCESTNQKQFMEKFDYLFICSQEFT